MTVCFTLATKTKVDAFRDSASIGDVVNYRIDCTPWQEENTAITSVQVVNDGGGNPGILTPLVTSGVVTFQLNFTQAGWNNIKITLTTATQKKTIWLKINVIDRSYSGEAGDDYGFSD